MAVSHYTPGVVTVHPGCAKCNHQPFGMLQCFPQPSVRRFNSPSRLLYAATCKQAVITRVYVLPILLVEFLRGWHTSIQCLRYGEPDALRIEERSELPSHHIKPRPLQPTPHSHPEARTQGDYGIGLRDSG